MMNIKEEHIKEWQKLKNERATVEVLAEFLRNNRYGLPVDYRHRELIK